MTPDRRPIFFIGSLSNVGITPTNPTGLNEHWLAAEPGWLESLRHQEAMRVMLSDPAGWTAFTEGGTDGGQVRWPHWYTLTDAQRAEMESAATAWRAAGVTLGLYPGRKIAPPDVLDWDAHVNPIPSYTVQQWVTASIAPYADLGFTEFGIDAASTLSYQEWRGLSTMIRTAAGRGTRTMYEALKTSATGGPDPLWCNQWGGLCLWAFMAKPAANPRWLDPAWSVDPTKTELHVLLTGAEAQVPGRVQALENKGYIVSARNQWWL